MPPDTEPTSVVRSSTSEVPVVDYALPERAGSRLGTGFLPATASLYLPGLGQLIAGDRRRAAVWFVAWLVLLAASVATLVAPALFIAIVVVAPLGAVFTIACVVDAFVRGRKSPKRMLDRPLLRYVAGVALIVAGLYLNPSALAAMFAHSRVEALVVPTRSMAPTLQPGDHIMSHKNVAEVRRWDVIVFDSPENPGSKWVARVAGLPGETVEIRDGELIVNGSAVTRPPGAGPYQQPRYTSGNGAAGDPMSLGAGEYFVLGDNSPVAADSRYWKTPAPGGHPPGALPRERIIGKVTWIYWPLSRWRRF